MNNFCQLKKHGQEGAGIKSWKTRGLELSVQGGAARDPDIALPGEQRENWRQGIKSIPLRRA